MRGITDTDVVEITLQRFAFRRAGREVLKKTGMFDQRQNHCLKIGMKNYALMNKVAELLRIFSIPEDEWKREVAMSKIK